MGMRSLRLGRSNRTLDRCANVAAGYARRMTGAVQRVHLGAAVATVLLPLLGAWWRRPESLASVFEFPPRLHVPSGYPAWSWWWCLGILLPFAVVALAWRRYVRHDPAAQVTAAWLSRPLPWWGAAACAWVLVWWGLAWTRFDWFATVQRFTFFPLWIGFVVAVSAATEARDGRSLLRRAPLAWCRLAGASALFWWGFEWLNRFVQNWHYLGVEDFGALAYATHASLCFSTVLPAVLAVRELLQTVPSLQRRLAAGPPLRWLGHGATGAVCGGLGLAALLLTGAYPQLGYPSLWLAPLLLIVGLHLLTGRPGWWNELAAGDWRRAGSWALAAFACGLGWELWNFHSAAKWIYTLPYADRVHIFEMPLLGYLGYFGFGLECCVAAELVLRRRA
jgi:hypothetical protein